MNINDYISKVPCELISGNEVPELRMLKLYAFNQYFNADLIRAQDLLNSTSYSRKNKFGIDGVYLNESLEEDTIECVYSYYVENDVFSQVDVLKAINFIQGQIDEVRQGHFTTDDKSDSILNDQIKEFIEGEQKVNIIIRVITSYTPNPTEKYEIQKKVSEYPVSVKGYKVSAEITFGDEIIALVDGNTAPFDYVADGKLIVDDAKNVLKYGNDSFVCNIKAQSLKKLWELEGLRGLLAMNLRYYIKAGNIDSKIEDSILFNGDNFWYLNNGIIIVCDEYNFVGNELRLTNFSIVNGGQTTRMIGTIPFTNDFSICCKVVKNTFKTPEEKNIFISQVAEASNTQKPIKAKDIIANKIEQRNLKTLMGENKVFIEIKRGDKYDHNIYTEPWQRTKNNELAQDLFSFVFMEPGPARNAVSKILQNDEKYDLIFKNHKYNFDFLRDILFLEKSYREYKNKVTKDDSVDATKKGLVKNGMFYTLATIGYILKLAYNPEYYNDIQKHRSNPAYYNLYSTELAFTNGFISKGLSYTEFKKKAFDMFDFVFAQLMIPQFNMQKELTPSLAYSNWTKSNTGFNNIRTYINGIVFDSKQTFILQGVTKHCCDITQDQKDNNIDTYVDYCKANKKIVAKTSTGYALNEDDEALRNDLMVFRMNYSQSHHIAEKNVFGDKQLDKIVAEKPLNKNELKKIVSATTAYYCGDEIVKIIEKHI